MPHKIKTLTVSFSKEYCQITFSRQSKLHSPSKQHFFVSIDRSLIEHLTQTLVRPGSCNKHIGSNIHSRPYVKQRAVLQRGGQLPELGRSVTREASKKLECTETKAGGLCKSVIWFQGRILISHPAHLSCWGSVPLPMHSHAAGLRRGAANPVCCWVTKLHNFLLR